MRLIDADNFRRYAHEQLKSDKTYTADEILEMIDDQSIAYNIEKVVEQLKQRCDVIQTSQEYIPYSYALLQSRSIFEKDYETPITIREAIEIVRKGGKQ